MDLHRPQYHGYDVARFWDRGEGLSVRRLVRDQGVVAIPRSLPGYRVALSLAHNRASLAIGRRVTTDGGFAPGTDVLGQPGDNFNGEMRDRVDVLLFLMEPSYVATQFDMRGLPGARAELRDLPAQPDAGLLDAGRRLADAMARGLAGDELYCEMLIDAMVTRIVTRHASMTSGRMPYREESLAGEIADIGRFHRRQSCSAAAACRARRGGGAEPGSSGARLPQCHRGFIASLRVAAPARTCPRAAVTF